MEQLLSIECPEYLLEPIERSPIRTLRKKFITKPCFDIDVLNSIWNGDKYYKKIKRSDREIGKGNFKRAKIFPKKLITRKTLLKKELLEIRIIQLNCGEIEVFKYAF